MLFLQLLHVVWPAPEVGIGFTLGLTFAMVNFREGKLAPKRKKVLRARASHFRPGPCTRSRVRFELRLTQECNRP
jgi:hypothetical protein